MFLEKKKEVSLYSTISLLRFLMAHEHHHHHHHPTLTYDQTTGRNFILGIVLNLAFVLIEAGAGLWLGSLALLSDAGHNLSDVFSLLLALLAFRMMRIQPSQKYTYGYKRMTILVSLVNALLLFVAVAAILWSSVEKILHPSPVQGDVVAWVAGIGILVNAFTAYLFFKVKDHDLNVKGAYLHMAADTLVSVGVLVAGVVIQLTGWYIVDPLIGIVVGVAILFSSWGPWTGCRGASTRRKSNRRCWTRKGSSGCTTCTSGL